MAPHFFIPDLLMPALPGQIQPQADKEGNVDHRQPDNVLEEDPADDFLDDPKADRQYHPNGQSFLNPCHASA